MKAASLESDIAKRGLDIPLRKDVVLHYVDVRYCSIHRLRSDYLGTSSRRIADGCAVVTIIEILESSPGGNGPLDRGNSLWGELYAYCIQEGNLSRSTLGLGVEKGLSCDYFSRKLQR